MKVVELLRRAAGMPPAHLLKRGLWELVRQLSTRLLLGRWQSLGASEIAQRAEFPSLSELWCASSARFLGLDPAGRTILQKLTLSEYPEEASLLNEACQKILDHEFDLLGSGPTQLGREIDWHLDFKSGKRWDDQTSSLSIDCADLRNPSDVKVPWELSRCQHLVTLARGWIIFRDERYVEEFQTQVRSWIRSNPLGRGVNWSCTMDVALRAVSWIWALSLFEDAPLAPDFREEMLLSLFQHGLWIPRNLEMGVPNGNHYLSDVLGMLACGIVFKATPEGSRWFSQGRRLLEEASIHQIGKDGAGIEGSVPYHRLVLELFLVGSRLCKVAGEALSESFDQRLKGMFEFIHAYTAPNGTSPILGDCDDGRALILGETPTNDHRYLLSTGSVLFGNRRWKTRAARCWPDTLWLLGPGAREIFTAIAPLGDCTSQHFGTAGYHVLRTRNQYLFVDAGPVGFGGRGGHGHNDCLSFEWHVGGQPILTDSGSFVYTASPEWRNRFRSTAYHNTIRIDREEINRFYSKRSLWMLQDDARPSGVNWDSTLEREHLSVGHTGYQRLPSPVQVKRKFELMHSTSELCIRDSISGSGQHRIEVFFHAAPGARAEHIPGGVALEWSPPNRRRLEIRTTSQQDWKWKQESGWFSPSYGIKVSRIVWAATQVAKLPIDVTWNLQVTSE